MMAGRQHSFTVLFLEDSRILLEAVEGRATINFTGSTHIWIRGNSNYVTHTSTINKVIVSVCMGDRLDLHPVGVSHPLVHTKSPTAS
jgi:hypothetical protein